MPANDVFDDGKTGSGTPDRARSVIVDPIKLIAQAWDMPGLDARIDIRNRNFSAGGRSPKAHSRALTETVIRESVPAYLTAFSNMFEETWRSC